MKFYVLAGAIGAVGVLVAEGPAGAAELLQNGGFEQPYLGPFNWAYPGSTSYPGNPPEFIPIPTATLDSWTYDGSALVNGQVGSDWYGPVPPVGFGGLQFAALQMQSTISQDFASPGGNLTLSWLAGGRPADPNGTYFGDQSYLVELDGTTVGSFSTVSGEVFTSNLLALGPVTPGEHTLSFQGLSSLDETSFLDDVSIRTGAPVVPEPSTWMMLLLGLGALGARMRARHVAA